MHKLGHFVSGQWVEHSYAPVFRLPDSPNKSALVAGVPGGDPLPFIRLVSGLEPPYHLLYVLHTPRGEGKAGRYQSPPLSLTEFQDFITEFQSFLMQDARFDIWAYSLTEKATIVWDRHNRLFAYGPFARFASELQALGFFLGEPDIGFDHEHYYHPEHDSQAKTLLDKFDWSYSPLQEADEQ